MMKLVKKCMIIVLTASMILGGTMTSFADVVQSDRWEGSGDTWKVRTQDNTGYLSNSWFQDNDGSWYMLGADGNMYSGLITDQSTGKSYLLNTNHDGTFGRMLTQDGVYTINGSQVYLQFNQSHDGSYGAILTGLSEARSTGVKETSLTSIPSDSASTNTMTDKELDKLLEDAGLGEPANVGTIDPEANKGMDLQTDPNTSTGGSIWDDPSWSSSGSTSDSTGAPGATGPVNVGALDGMILH